MNPVKCCKCITHLYRGNYKVKYNSRTGLYEEYCVNCFRLDEKFNKDKYLNWKKEGF